MKIRCKGLVYDFNPESIKQISLKHSDNKWWIVEVVTRTDKGEIVRSLVGSKSVEKAKKALDLIIQAVWPHEDPPVLDVTEYHD